MYETYARICLAGICAFAILTALCTYGWNYFNLKIKQQEKALVVSKKDSTGQAQNVYQIQGDMVEKKIVSDTSKSEKIYAPNAGIVTIDQRGGSNTVNQYYNAKDPNDLVTEPVFEEDGIYGKNILAKNIVNLSQTVEQYSLAIKKPEKATVKVIISVPDKVNSSMAFRLGTNINWIKKIVQLGYFEFILPPGQSSGDYSLRVNQAGTATIKCFIDDTELFEKEVHWQ